MKFLTKPVLLAIIALSAFSFSNANAGSCSVGVGIGTWVTSSCTSFALDRTFAGKEGQSVVLSCAAKSGSKDFSIRGGKPVASDSYQPGRMRHAGHRKIVSEYHITKTGPVQIEVSDVQVTGEGNVVCLVFERGGMRPYGVR